MLVKNIIMKVKKIFKKSQKEVKVSNIQKVDKAQLEKVVGGATIETQTSSAAGGGAWWGHCNG